MYVTRQTYQLATRIMEDVMDLMQEQQKIMLAILQKGTSHNSQAEGKMRYKNILILFFILK